MGPTSQTSEICREGSSMDQSSATQPKLTQGKEKAAPWYGSYGWWYRVLGKQGPPFVTETVVESSESSHVVALKQILCVRLHVYR